MNTKLFETVKQKCKDTGLSEKYLKAITEKLGGSVADDSTDETAINDAANLISDLAKESQGEATRWASKKKSETEKDKSDDGNDDGDKSDKDDSGKGGSDKSKGGKTTDPDPEIVALKKRIDEFEKEKLKTDRESAIRAAKEKHKIPDWRMKGLAVPEDQDPDAFMADIRQDLISQKLIPADSEGSKAASEKQVNEAADALLESITPK